MIRTKAICAGSAVLALLVALVLSGCGSSDASEGNTAGGRTHMTWFMWSGSDEEVMAWKVVSDMVTATHPDITLTFQTTSWSDYWTKFPAQVDRGNAPCILGMQSMRNPQFGNRLRPLDSMLASNDVELSQFDKSIVDGLKVNGTQVAVPYDFGPRIMFYNKTAFAKAGLAEPKPGWTMDEFLADAKKLTSGSQYGFAAYPYLDFVVPFTRSLNGALPVSDRGQLQLTDPRFRQALQWYAGLVQKEKVAPAVPPTSDLTWPFSQFVAGRAAMVVTGPWDLINAKRLARFDIGIAPIPAGANGSKSVTAGSGFGISANCKTPDKAMQAISVITGPEAQQYLAEQGRAFPARKAQQKFWYRNAVPGAKKSMDAAVQSSVPYATTKSWNTVNQLFTKYGVPATNGQVPVDQFLNTVQQQAGAR